MSLLERNLDKANSCDEYLYKTCPDRPQGRESLARVLSQQKLNMGDSSSGRATSTSPCVPPPTTQWSMP